MVLCLRKYSIKYKGKESFSDHTKPLDGAASSQSRGKKIELNNQGMTSLATSWIIFGLSFIPAYIVPTTQHSPPWRTSRTRSALTASSPVIQIPFQASSETLSSVGRIAARRKGYMSIYCFSYVRFRGRVKLWSKERAMLASK